MKIYTKRAPAEEPGLHEESIDLGVELTKYKVDDRVGKKCHDNTDHCVEDSVFRTCNALLVATREDVAEATDDKHDHSNDADREEHSISDYLDLIDEWGATCIALRTLGTASNCVCTTCCVSSATKCSSHDSIPCKSQGTFLQ